MNREYYMDGEARIARIERWHKVLKYELEDRDYACATMTMRWLQEDNVRPRISYAQAAELMMEWSTDCDFMRINWSEVDYVD